MFKIFVCIIAFIFMSLKPVKPDLDPIASYYKKGEDNDSPGLLLVIFLILFVWFSILTLAIL